MQKFTLVTNKILHLSNCRRALNAEEKELPIKVFNNITDIEDLTSYKYCKCCSTLVNDYIAYKRISNFYDKYVKILRLYTDNFNYQLSPLKDQGNSDIEIKTNVEKWIIHINSFYEDGTAKVTLYHRNNINFAHPRKGKCVSVYPDYHVQFVKVMLPSEIINYVNRHEVEKWGAKVVVRSEMLVFAKV